MRAYDHQKIEKEAQEKWAKRNLYQTDLSDTSKEPYYLLTEFPYPSGDLHTGHWYAYALPDVYARYLRMQGKHNVLFPIGFDAFGLPAENAAIKNNVDPRAWTESNMARMRTQLQSMGTSFDWSKEVVTCDPAYYKWTQWLFTKLLEHGLAYRGEAAVKWCPKDQTVLANEQVVDGCCERCGTPVEEKRLTQWFFKITEYAERLLEDLEPLPWREEVKDAQRAWIGKSEGARLHFKLSSGEESIEVFTTRPDTIFGATYVVLAPEHALVSKLITEVSNKKDVEKYVAETKKKTERERSENKKKTGVKLEGVSAINPATKEEIPVYVADYVLASYGTGAVMAVPAHDERDFEFATKMKLPIKQVVAPRYYQTTEPGLYRPNEPTLEKHGVIVMIKHWSEDKYMGLAWKEVAWGTFLTGGVDEGMTPDETVIKEIREETGFLHPKITQKYGVVDGIFYHVPKQKNQHVHGHMFVVELEDGEREAVTADEEAKHEIKWLTPKELKKFLTPDTHQHTLRIFMHGAEAYTGDGSLVDSGPFTGRLGSEAKWDIVESVGGKRETQYRLRDWLISRQRYWGCPIPIVYDPEGKAHAVPPEHLPWLLPTDVDFAPTGNESPLATSKELKERVQKIFGEGWTPEYDTLDTFVDSSWYFLRYLDSHDDHDFSDQSLMKKWLPIDRYSGGSEHTTMHLLYARFFHKALFDLACVPTPEPFKERYNRGLILGTDGQKMSKRWGNVINPDELVKEFGADAVRVFLAFIGPYNEPGSYPWSLTGVPAMRKFLERIIRAVEKADDSEPSPQLVRTLARTAKKVGSDCERFKFNTAVAAIMTLLNELEALPQMPKKAARDLVLMLAPLAPHLSEHLWETLHEEGSVHEQSWPHAEELIETDEMVNVVVQVAGKKRGTISLAATATEEEALAEAQKVPAVETALGGKKPSRTIYVAGRVLNLVPEA